MKKVGIYLRRKERKMRTVMLILGVVLVFSIVSYSSAEKMSVLNEDGVIWQKISESHKIGFISGLFTGMKIYLREVENLELKLDREKFLGETKGFLIEEMRSQIIKEIEEHKGIDKARIENMYDSYYEEIKRRWLNKKKIGDTPITNSLFLSSITVGQLEDGVDTFYKDFSNRRIKIIDAIYVVKMQIKGENPDLIDAQIRYLRMQPIDEEALAEAFERVSDIRIKISASKGEERKKLDENKMYREDSLKTGVFVDENQDHLLFCYGQYE